MNWTTSLQKESKLSTLIKEFHSLLYNLYCGLKLLAFRSDQLKCLTVSHDQLFLLLICYGLTAVIATYWITERPVFEWYGLGYLGIELIGILLIGFLLAKFSRKKDLILKFLILVYCISPFLILIFSLILSKLPDGYYLLGYLVFLVWKYSTYYHIVLQIQDQNKITALMMTCGLFITAYPLIIHSHTLTFWYEDYYQTNERSIYTGDILNYVNQEQLYYDQYRLLHNALNLIHPGALGKPEIFFVGFGSDATQDVFMRETKHIQNASNAHLGTIDRSMVMINNVKTMDSIPLATSTNLALSLAHISRKMNLEEDVLFLYLTSHGSSNHELAVNMWLLDLNDIRPEDIKAYLDEAGIRWRVILISACYSGGFIQKLQNENSLIFTAAAADKTSFGCVNENEFTYFGEALFDQIKREPYSLEASFKMAIENIKQRELSEDLPHSEPQLFIGNMMLDKLKQLEQEIRFP
ncbi:MAG: hypothetical protein IPI97_01670 [Nitrosomonas sp.]|nr:hypothetical protein [Nitrosomonas sp.]